MSNYTMDCPPLDACGPCGTLPPGFVRLRYFFGKRMGVADFLDEQRYHAGKMRFHNQRLHGAGLLCGLAVSRQSTTDVLLRVGKGAAIDACGREILVGYDQCIDLDAWYQRELLDRRATDATWPASALDGDGKLPLVVLLRFRDCAASPEPAPRDPCACDAAGCDFGRVREEFELDIVTANDPATGGTLPLTPPRAALERVLGGARPDPTSPIPFGAGLIARGLATAATVGCPDPDPQGWLVLATFKATLAVGPDGLQHITDITAPLAKATLLAETALLQELLARTLAAQLEAGALVDGPEIESLGFERDGATSFYWLVLELTKPIIAETLPANAFTVTRLATSGTPGWSAIAATTDYVAPTATTRAKIRVRVDNAANVLQKDGLYRVAIDPAKVPNATPIVDDQLRPLRPLHPSIHFSFDKPAADLVLAPAPYAR